MVDGLPKHQLLLQYAMPKNNYNRKSAPNLLRGILLSCIGITCAILLLTWFIINLKIDDLVTQRTSEYAHSIARIAADSSAEPLLSEDIIQLNLLVENVARDPIIKQATVYSEDGQIISQFPSENALQQPIGSIKSQFDPNEAAIKRQEKVDAQKKAQQDFIKRQKNIPFIEKIAYQGVTAGWFKLEVDSFLLENNLRSALIQVQIFSGTIALVLFALLVFIVLRLEHPIKRLAENCQHLLIQHKIRPPKNTKQWLAAIETLSGEHAQQLTEHIQLPANTILWDNAKKIDNVLTVLLQFDIKNNENIDYSSQLSQAEDYLNQSIQAFGVQSQGDILTGCLIPFSNINRRTEGFAASELNNALSFIALVRKLMSTLNVELNTKVSISCSNILLLENENELVTGITILGEQYSTLKRLLLTCDNEKIVCLWIPRDHFKGLAEIQERTNETVPELGSFLLSKVSHSIIQQVERKFSYIVQSS
jgi:uncharacterized membrane protein affecting hemolysin expression